jgi:hypothetical protein
MTETAVGLGASRADGARPYPSLGEALRVWLRVAMLSFGGPAGQIAVMHRILVHRRVQKIQPWLLQPDAVTRKGL